MLRSTGHVTFPAKEDTRSMIPFYKVGCSSWRVYYFTWFTIAAFQLPPKNERQFVTRVPYKKRFNNFIPAAVFRRSSGSVLVNGDLEYLEEEEDDNDSLLLL
jgi:hypothetical protein